MPIFLRGFKVRLATAALTGLALLAGQPSAQAARPLGIDVSHWQGAFNWTNAKNANVEFAYCKASQDTNYTDTQFVNNQKGAAKVGIPIGAYHFANYDTNFGTNGANAEANYFWNVIKSYVKADGTRLMPMLDLENVSSSIGPSQAGYTKTTFSQWANAFCTTLSNNAFAAGIRIKPVIYTSSSFAGTWLNSTVTKWIPWIANWNGQDPQTGGTTIATSPWSAWVCWQYGSMSIPGYGTVDGDVFNGTSAGLKTTLMIGGNPPIITNQPASLTLSAGANATFSVGVSGATPLSYQWRLNGSTITGATLSSYTRPNVQLADAGSYSVTVTNASGTTNSANAVLTVHAPPIITAQPTNTISGVGVNVTFSVTATGSPTLGYQWRFNGTNISGATTNKLLLSGVQATNAGTYVVAVYNSYGSTNSSNAVLTVVDPLITNQPQSLVVGVGAPASFTVRAVGTPQLTYSWRRNGVPVSDGPNLTGSATATLALASVQPTDVGTYSVLVTNNNGWVLSSNATLFAAFAPSIVTQPTSQTVQAASVVTLTVSAIGPEPITYQWRRGATNLANLGYVSGATSPTLTLSNFQAWDMENYSVVLVNSNGTTTSSNALVNVWPLAAWGAGRTNNNKPAQYGQSLVPSGASTPAAIAAGMYHSLALRPDGTLLSWGAGLTNKGTSPDYGQSAIPSGLSNVVDVSGGYYHTLALTTDGLVQAWGAGTNNSGTSPDYGQSMVPPGLSEVRSVVAGGYHSLALKSDGTVLAWGAGTINTGVTPELGQSVVPAGLSNVVALAGGGYHTLALQANGTLVGWGAGSINTGTSPNYGQAMTSGLSNIVTMAAGGYHSLALKLDGTVLAWGDNTYGQANVPAGLSNVVAIAAGRYNSLALQCDGTILAWGAGTTNSGTSPNFGQSIILPGLSRVKAIAAGGYHTLALEGDGGPSLTGTLHDQTVTAGEAVTYAAMAAGRQPMSYQWQFNGADLPGATAGVLNLTNVQAAQAGSYSVVISNDSGSVIGSAALVVLSAPVITEQPENQAVVEGAPVAFTVEAIGSAPLRYQWRYDGASIAGATESSYSLLSAQSTNVGAYSAVVSNALGSVTSSPALLVVLLPPIITTQPSNHTAVAGEDVSFSVLVDSVAALNYRWFFGTNEVGGANEATLSLTNVQPANAGDYVVVANNVAGSITSSIANLTVLVPPPPTDLLSGPGFTPAGAFQFNVAGQAGSSYVVESSTNLSYWRALQTNTSPFSFTDTNAANLPRQFYRAYPAP